MNVIPFPVRQEPRQEQEPLAFTIGARVDLRIGALAAGVVRPRDVTTTTFAFTSVARLLRAARMTWRERGAYAPLMLSVPNELYALLDAELMSEAAVEAGCTRQKLSFELCERAVVRHGPVLAEELRARGWGVALRGDAECPVPFGAKARALYTELVLDAPETPDPFLAMTDGDRSPLGRRVVAAQAAGLVITAEAVRTASQARMLAIAGFDRGGGAFAEAGLR